MKNYKKIVDRYIDKWDKILFSTQPVDRDKATKAVIDAYGEIGLPPPEIFFLSSPSLEQNLNFVSVSGDKQRDPIRLKSILIDKLLKFLNTQAIDETNLDHRLMLENAWISANARGEIFGKACNTLYEQHVYNVNFRYNINIHKILEYELSGTNSWFYDFYINQVYKDPNLEIWNILRYLCEECPYLLTYEDACLIIDRPSELYLNQEFVLHAEGKAAIKYADGYELCCNHGTVIPAKYGQIQPSDWKSESIVFDEDNSVIREDSESIISILFNIGYQKFSREMPSTRERYWIDKKGLLRSFLRGFHSLIEYSFMSIMEWLEFHCGEYYILGEPIDWHIMDFAARELAKNFQFKLSEELEVFYSIKCEEKYQLAPGLSVCPLQHSGRELEIGSNIFYPVQIFQGERQEIYYVLCDNIQRPYSHVYCQFPNAEPFVYAECISSMMATISQCYRDGGYYIAINEQSGAKEIKQDLYQIKLRG
jgi:hypothetical protein